MKIKFWDTDTLDVNIKCIKPHKEKYLKKIGESSIKNLSLPKANNLFHLVIEDFKKGVLSSDDLSAFGFEIFHGVAKNYPKSELFKTSLSVSELSFYLRSKSDYKNISRCLEGLDKFFIKNR